MTELQIIEGCLAEDPLAQRELFNRYSAKMLSVCYRFAASREDAEDMLQEAFIKIYAQLHTFQHKGSFEGWIRRIIVHSCINILKKNKKFSNSADLDEVEEYITTRESVYGAMQAKKVIECIRLLPLGYRTVLNLFAIEGYSHREIGEILEIGESTSRSQYTRAKNLLEQILIKQRVIDQPELGRSIVTG